MFMMQLKLLEESSALQKKSSEELAKKLESYMEKLKEVLVMNFVCNKHISVGEGLLVV
jgi:hypothetical protein